jgi:hypothetical protein
MKMDPDIEPTVREVIDVAALLDTTEFNIFCLAYGQWFGHQAKTDIIEPYFNAYMFNDIVPHWVHHFTRQILKIDHKGLLSPEDYGLNRPPASAKMVLVGRLYAVFLLLALLVLLVLTQSSEQLLLIAKNCYFPPCY